MPPVKTLLVELLLGNKCLVSASSSFSTHFSTEAWLCGSILMPWDLDKLWFRCCTRLLGDRDLGVFQITPTNKKEQPGPRAANCTSVTSANEKKEDSCRHQQRIWEERVPHPWMCSCCFGRSLTALCVQGQLIHQPKGKVTVFMCMLHFLFIYFYLFLFFCIQHILATAPFPLHKRARNDSQSGQNKI